MSMRINLRGKRIFQGMHAVLVSPEPIRVLAVFGSEKALKESFQTCLDHIKNWGSGFKANYANAIIETPNGSRLIFKTVSTRFGFGQLQGYEIHDYWIDDNHPLDIDLHEILESRRRL